MNIIIIGPQGSGKSTQAAMLADKLNISHIQTGEIYRRLAGENTPLGRRVKAVLDAGGLMADEVTFEVVDQYLKELTDGFAIDGFPRTLAQAGRELFPVDKVFYLRLSDEEAIKRLQKRGRFDDTADIIAERLKLYHAQTEPILDYYRHQGKLIEIDGSGTIEEVAALIDKAL